MRDWLRDKRCRLGLTQQQVADASGIQRAYFTMIERGERRPSVQVAKCVADVLGFEWTLFFDLQGNDMKRITGTEGKAND